MSLSRNVSELVDELGDLQNEADEVRERIAEVRGAILQVCGAVRVLEGQHWDVELRTIGPSHKTEWRAVALALKPSKRLIDRHSRLIEPYTQFRVFGKD